MKSRKYETIERTRKLLIVGHPTSGKRSLLDAFQHKEFSDNSWRSIFDMPVVPIQIHEKIIHLALCHTYGQEEYDRLRQLVYHDTNVVLICFSIDDPISVIYATEKWAPEIQRYCDRCPTILVGCKTDLRTDPKTIGELNKIGEKPLTTNMGRKIAGQIKADAYIECSAKTGEGVEDLLNEAARLSIRKSSRRPVTCQCILQ